MNQMTDTGVSTNSQWILAQGFLLPLVSSTVAVSVCLSTWSWERTNPGCAERSLMSICIMQWVWDQDSLLHNIHGVSPATPTGQ